MNIFNEIKAVSTKTDMGTYYTYEPSQEWMDQNRERLEKDSAEFKRVSVKIDMKLLKKRNFFPIYKTIINKMIELEPCIIIDTKILLPIIKEKLDSCYIVAKGKQMPGTELLLCVENLINYYKDNLCELIRANGGTYEIIDAMTDSKVTCKVA